DSAYDELYKSEHIVGRIAAWFAILAVFISCLGLFGLATFSAERRVKEIGIRKVLGATAGDVVRLLSRDFLKLVLLGIAIAAPVAWWATRRWLSDFPYRIELSWWIFVLAGSLSIAIAFITVSFQSVRAALSNPVKSLRSE
ncbi:MAG: ABC transporter permease, partial [Thermoanaerobaculia bacterium]|nr:ABC transporter permease [Thermoanaerobaculia bacterium]